MYVPTAAPIPRPYAAAFLGGALLLAAVACDGRGRVGAAPLRIEHTSPVLGDPERKVLLNDALTVYFSQPIQPLSVTPDSVALLDEDGNQVRGSLDVGSNWVAFRPEPPLEPDLRDGSFRPGGHYRLRIAGRPRVDAVRSRDGRWLEQMGVFDVFVAAADERPVGLPAILRPPNPELPFVLQSPENVPQVAADAPRLELHANLPVLPSSVHAEDFVVQCLSDSVLRLEVRSARVVTSPLDAHPGCTVELQLGGLSSPMPGGVGRALREGDFLTVLLAPTARLLDYAGRAPLLPQPLYWSVVAGRSLPLCEWPGDGEIEFDDGVGVAPGFEVHSGALRPRCRLEAGHGRLGRFRPQHDVTLRAGASCDRGDGVLVAGDGGVFAFRGFEVPPGVTVTIDARAVPVCVLSTGGIHIEGQLRLLGPTAPLPPVQFGELPVRDLLDSLPVVMCAAGDVVVRGAVEHEQAIGAGETGLLLATAGRLGLHGELPFQTMLVVEDRTGEARGRIDGARGQSRPYAAGFTSGIADGADYEAVAVLPWRKLPLHRDAGRLQFEASAGVEVDWQVAAPDPVDPDRPDLGSGRSSRWRSARSGDVLVVGAGGFVRVRVRAAVRAGEALPVITRLRLVEP